MSKVVLSMPEKFLNDVDNIAKKKVEHGLN